MESKKKSNLQTFNFASSNGYETISKWIFWIGLVIAVVAGAMNYLTLIVLGFLVVFGLIVGFFRVKDDVEFLIGGLAFIFLVSFAKDIYIITILGNIIDGVSALISPAIIVVALKKVFKAMR